VGQKPVVADWSDTLRKSFGASFWVFVGITLLTAVVTYNVLGRAVFFEAVAKNQELLANFLPRVLAAQVVAGFVWVLLPRDRMAQFLQRSRGRRGLLIATAAGAITPGGPASAFPFLAILAGSGADRGVLVAYITSWALLGLQRIIVWDFPLMGIDFTLVRFLVCLPLPIIAGALARRIPYAALLASNTKSSEESGR
jgi:uncharacterized membrane protein YraQ (UPF0718 family)